MNYVSELKHIAHHLFSWFVFLLMFFLFFFSFGMREVQIFERTVFIPFPTTHSFAISMFEHMKSDLVPAGVELVVTSPLTAFLVQMKIALFLAFTISFPFLLHKLILFIRPALYSREQKASLAILAPSAILFLSGVLFSYFIIIPPTFSVLYTYTASIGATPYFGVGEFVSLTFALLFAVGVMFLLPMFMYALSWLGILERGFWHTHWRYAFFSFLVLSAIITPDGSGISMTLLTIPLITLYGLGIIISNKT